MIPISDIKKPLRIPRGKVSCPHSSEKMAAGFKSRPVWSKAPVPATRLQGFTTPPKQVRGKIL